MSKFKNCWSLFKNGAICVMACFMGLDETNEENK